MEAHVWIDTYTRDTGWQCDPSAPYAPDTTPIDPAKLLTPAKMASFERRMGATVRDAYLNASPPSWWAALVAL